MRHCRLVDGLLAEAEVGELDMALSVEQDVLGLEVAIDDALPVEMLQRQRDLGDVEAGRVLQEDALALEVHEQLATTEVLQDEVELTFSLKNRNGLKNS